MIYKLLNGLTKMQLVNLIGDIVERSRERGATRARRRLLARAFQVLNNRGKK